MGSVHISAEHQDQPVICMVEYVAVASPNKYSSFKIMAIYSNQKKF